MTEGVALIVLSVAVGVQQMECPQRGKPQEWGQVTSSAITVAREETLEDKSQ